MWDVQESLSAARPPPPEFISGDMISADRPEIECCNEMDAAIMGGGCGGCRLAPLLAALLEELSAGSRQLHHAILSVRQGGHKFFQKSGKYHRASCCRQNKSTDKRKHCVHH